MILKQYNPQKQQEWGPTAQLRGISKFQGPEFKQKIRLESTGRPDTFLAMCSAHADFHGFPRKVAPVGRTDGLRMLKIWSSAQSSRRIQWDSIRMYHGSLFEPMKLPRDGDIRGPEVDLLCLSWQPCTVHHTNPLSAKKWSTRNVCLDSRWEMQPWISGIMQTHFRHCEWSSTGPGSVDH